jgi:AbrB family looped-hinge helix DNA binding protein
MQHYDKTHAIFRARVDPVGRVVIPANVRQRLGIVQGDELILGSSD